MLTVNDFYASLIGIERYLPNELPDGASYKSLKGCVRDISHVEAFLKRQFNLPSERIYKLTASNADGSSEPSEPPEQLPTYENIVGKFKEITEKAQPQDQELLGCFCKRSKLVKEYPRGYCHSLKYLPVYRLRQLTHTQNSVFIQSPTNVQ